MTFQLPFSSEPRMWTVMDQLSWLDTSLTKCLTDILEVLNQQLLMLEQMLPKYKTQDISSPSMVLLNLTYIFSQAVCKKFGLIKSILWLLFLAKHQLKCALWIFALPLLQRLTLKLFLTNLVTKSKLMAHFLMISNINWDLTILLVFSINTSSGKMQKKMLN